MNQLAVLIARPDESTPIGAIKAVTDNLAAMIVDRVFTVAAMANVPVTAGQIDVVQEAPIVVEQD